VDAELIVMGQRLWDDLALPPIALELNSIGDAEERRRHRADLVAHFEAHADVLDADARRRLHTNPLRILDSKNPAMQSLIESAPKLLGYLSEASLAHFDGVQALLREAGVPYRINPRLVRGLDYYNRTVFEWVTTELGAQGTVCGGGRYDPLVELCGGKPTPGCGFAIGVERVLELMRQSNDSADVAAPAAHGCDVYIVHQGEAAARRAFALAERLRSAAHDVVLHAGGGSMKSQMKRADASGAALALILGDDELASDSATLKSLRGDGGDRAAGVQQRVPLSMLEQAVSDALLA
jgi:histidyl-tRNA synthetase